MNAAEAQGKFAHATTLYREKRYPEALQVLDELDANQPFTQNILYPRALCLTALGRMEEASQICDVLEVMFQDPRAPKLKARCHAPEKPGPNGGASRTGKSQPLPSSKKGGKGFRPSVRDAVIVLLLIGVCALGYFLFTHRDLLKPGSRFGERPRPAESGAGPSAQEAIDEAMRRHMERSQDAPFTVLFDTGVLSKAPLTPGELGSRAGWTQVAEDQTDYQFQGDAVLMNNQVVAVLRNEGSGAEISAQNFDYPKAYANVVPMGVASTAHGLDALRVAKCGQDEIVLEATHRGGGGAPIKVRYELAMGQVSLKVTPIDGATRVRVEAPSRFAVLPDFFADDIVVDAQEVLGESAALPSENFLLHLRGDGEAIVMIVWENRDQEVQIAMDGQLFNRQIQCSEIAFGEEGAVWVALLVDKGMWHMRDIKADDKGKELPLRWQRPYPALWRVDWKRSDNLTDSWEMLTEIGDGHFKKHGLFEEEENSWTAQDWWGSGRTRIASGLGRFRYPCWVDRQGQGWLEPLLTESWGANQPLKGTPSFEGPALIYPLNRVSDTPLDKFTVVDVVRASLGVGPCEYILDVEGQQEAFEGMPTCSVRDILDEIYENGQQKQRRAEIEKALEDVVAFIALIRGRIDDYQAFAKEIRAFLRERQEENPELSPYIQEMEAFADRIDTAIAQRAEGIKTVKYATSLAKQFRSDLLDYDAADAAQKCKEITKAWVEIGGNQDTLVAECRVAVKLLRQTPAASLSQNPQRAELVREIRARTESILRSPVNYEAPRH